MSDDAAPLGEFELIERFFARRLQPKAAGVSLGIGDDAALLTLPPSSELVVSVDTLVAGRHFLGDADAYAVGHRALAVNLSDMAAMGATPSWATLALTLPTADAAWIERFSQGFFDLAERHSVALVGGDMTGGPLTISVQIMGSVPAGRALRRSGGRPGDLLVVTGTLGDSGAGLAIAQRRLEPTDRTAAEELLRRFEYPTPRVEFGIAARAYASGAMDISDGLAGDLPKFAAASGVGAYVDIERLPMSAALRIEAGAAQAERWALSAGEDFELLLSVHAGQMRELAAAALQLNLTLTTIGELRPGNQIEWRRHGQRVAAPGRGFDHFR